LNSRERILTTLAHKEPDRVPYDLASMQCTGIHVHAYRRLCEYLGINPGPIEFADVYQQVVRPCERLLDRLEVDTRGLYPLTSHNSGITPLDAGDYWEHLDAWGFTQRMPKQNGLWWSQVRSPLDGMTVTPERMAGHTWPTPDDSRAIAGLRELAIAYRAQGKIIVLKGFCAGLFEMAQRLRGMENILCDLAADPGTASLVLDRILELKKQFWAMALPKLGDVVDIVAEADDYGTQQSQLISHEMFRAIFEPRLRDLMGFIRGLLDRARPPGERRYVFFHSCGNIRPMLGDFIDMGIDIINPVHITAQGMDPYELKRDFGRHVTFWGGGVETQSVLPNGTPRQVAENVRRNLEALMPGGGYVFNTIHNIQADVPPENIVAMWEALREYGRY